MDSSGNAPVLFASATRILTSDLASHVKGQALAVGGGLSSWHTMGRRDPLQLLEDVRRLNVANVDVVVLSACVQMPSMPALQLAQDQLGIRATSTAACTVRNMLDLLGLKGPVPGFGAVLA